MYNVHMLRWIMSFSVGFSVGFLETDRILECKPMILDDFHKENLGKWIFSHEVFDLYYI